MGFFSSIFRFFSSVFGLAQGQTERATDAMVSSSPEAIRAQFRKTKEDWTRDYQQMRDALSQLIVIREQRHQDLVDVEKRLKEAEEKMAGAIQLYNKSKANGGQGDIRFREAYGQSAAKKVELEKRLEALSDLLEKQEKTIEGYKGRLVELGKQIQDLSKEEAETIADVVSAEKLQQLQDRLSGLSNDTQSKNLQAIREHRQKVNSTAKLTTELSGNEENELERKMKAAGAGAQYLDEFDAATGHSDDKPLSEAELAELEAMSKAK